jgi:hypothetical protein
MHTLMLIFVKMMQTPCVEARRTTDYTMDIIALLQQQFSPDRTIRTLMKKKRNSQLTDKNHPDQ